MDPGNYLGLLSDLSGEHSPARLLQPEVSMLANIVSDVSRHIRQRQHLEKRHLALLEIRQLRLESELLNIRASSDRRGELESLLERLKSEQVQVEEKVFKDVIDLKKSLWHYALLLYRKQAQIRFLK